MDSSFAPGIYFVDFFQALYRLRSVQAGANQCYIVQLKFKYLLLPKLLVAHFDL